MWVAIALVVAGGAKLFRNDELARTMIHSLSWQEYKGRSRSVQRRPPSPAPRTQIAGYGAGLTDTDTGRKWQCPHNHPTWELADRCADEMRERIKLLGWDKATEQGPGPRWPYSPWSGA